MFLEAYADFAIYTAVHISLTVATFYLPPTGFLSVWLEDHSLKSRVKNISQTWKIFTWLIKRNNGILTAVYFMMWSWRVFMCKELIMKEWSALCSRTGWCKSNEGCVLSKKKWPCKARQKLACNVDGRMECRYILQHTYVHS